MVSDNQREPGAWALIRVYTTRPQEDTLRKPSNALGYFLFSRMMEKQEIETF